ncbi:MAG TPA: 3-hydroxyacyl-CoA dehydrogenase NAD-binding domain-containing protein [Noviherbaspirillum sp.]|uniref:3-hydroxyacyl-CoA dehydrogenase NAD-binding domain-containing protein n=1 Tax=Noviherbaspirillum sp. TaxID=1926288 RepID=UPI002B4717BA|nr:3-hydroxyacyl-CoA dehydrogenase NAD-binding domain-containing protein [Noviherbaspirillum sp.]HJV87756.1 3-hydroxyacyl-CoA dehydrogenase NAD-binding domain-containing protein [Noviherbaspirillum sp.]
MSDLVSLERHGALGVLRINNPPVNALSPGVVEGIKAAVESFEADTALRALVVCAQGRTFVAGGDISEFDKPDFTTEPFNSTLNRIENLERPVVAALFGTVLGGGLELAMACHYRVAAPSTRLGLPEVLLGILPGSHGTQRLPRLVGAKTALDMMLSGRPIDAGKARAAGLVDEIVEGDVTAAAIRLAEDLIARGAGPRRTGERKVSMEGTDPDFFQKAFAEASTKKGAYPAPQRIVKCVEAAATLPLTEGQAVEARLFEECRVSPQSFAMRKLFFAERAATKIPGVPADAPTHPIKKVGVLGAGTMGGGIAMNFANANIPVVIVETSKEALDRGLGIVRKNYDASAAKGKMQPDEPARRMALLTGSLDYQDLADCDLVIEAVFENLDIKKQVARRLGEVCKAGAIIASNTSTLDVNILAQESGRAPNFLGMHFFSPANVMRLLEIVRGDKTAPDVLNTIVKLAKTIGKVPVVSGVCYGFIGNRMLESYLREADFLMMEGASPAQIDKAIQSLGLPMGPCRMLDLAGLDVAAKVVIERGKVGGLPNDPAYRAVVQKMMDMGRFGQKTGAGYYRYDGRTPVTDPEVEKVCIELAKQFGIARRTDITDEEIIERCLYPLINEGARILEEGISYRPSDIDLVWVNGYGFPDYRGGPMHMADTIGIRKIAERLDHYASTRGNQHGYWSKAGLLSTMCERQLRFGDWPFK